MLIEDSLVTRYITVSNRLLRKRSNLYFKHKKYYFISRDHHLRQRTSISVLRPEADPGFPRGATTSEGNSQSIILQNFCPQMHEIERIWTERGRASLALP